MRINFPRIKRLLKRVAGRRSESLYTLVKEKQVFCPDEIRPTPKAYFPEKTMEKVKTISPYRNWDMENLLINGGEIKYNGTSRSLIKDVTIIESALYSGGAEENIGYGDPGLFISDSGNQAFLHDANLTVTWSGCRWFACMLYDDFPLEIIPDDTANNILLVKKHYEHEPEYRRLLGLEGVPTLRNAVVENLWLYSDSNNNSFKAERFKMLRKRLLKNLGIEKYKNNFGVYLKRGSSGERRVLRNEEMVEAEMIKRGFTVVDVAALTASEVIQTIVGASVVVGVEGSHLGHAIYSMADNGAFVVIQPPDRFAMQFKEIADCLGMRFGFVVGDDAGEDFSVSVYDLCKILDAVM